MLRSTFSLATKARSRFSYSDTSFMMFANHFSQKPAELIELPLTRAFLLNNVKNAKLTNIVEMLYRSAAKYGSGSTADAVRYELITGDFLSKTNHLQKAIESRQALTELINSGKLNDEDAHIATSIRADLQSALTEEPWDKVYPGRKGLYK